MSFYLLRSLIDDEILFYGTTHLTANQIHNHHLIKSFISEAPLYLELQKLNHKFYIQYFTITCPISHCGRILDSILKSYEKIKIYSTKPSKYSLCPECNTRYVTLRYDLHLKTFNHTNYIMLQMN